MLRPAPTVLFLVLCVLAACGGGGGSSASARIPSLAILEFSGVTLSPAFSPDVIDYSGGVASTVDAVTVSANAGDSGDGIVVNGQALGSGSASAILSLSEGVNLISVAVVSSADLSVRTYAVTITRAPVPALDGLGVSAGALSPAFAPETTAYTSSVGFLALTLAVTPSTSVPGATIEVAGVPVALGQSSAPLPLVEGANPIVVRVTTAEGESRDYTVEVTRQPVSQFAEQALMQVSVGGPPFFGCTVVQDGDTLAIGVPYEDSTGGGVNSVPNTNGVDTGAVWVFVRDGMGWMQQAYLKADVPGDDDQFGFSLALSGDTLAVGAPLEDGAIGGISSGSMPNDLAPESGAVFVFRRTGTTWAQEAFLKADNPQPGDGFGTAVALDGDTLAVGAPGELVVGTDDGAVRVFTRTGSTWSAATTLLPAAGNFFGSSVALVDGTLVVGAPGEASSSTGVNSTPIYNAFGTGAVFVYVGSGATWTQEAYIKASNAGAEDAFGTRVAFAGDLLAVYARFEDSDSSGVNSTPNDNGTNVGAVYVFRRTGSTWSQEAYVKPSNPDDEDGFGAGLAIDGDRLVVGAIGEDGSSTGVNGAVDNGTLNSGAVYVFTRGPSGWAQDAYVKASNNALGSGFGFSLVLDGDALVVCEGSNTNVLDVYVLR